MKNIPSMKITDYDILDINFRHNPFCRTATPWYEFGKIAASDYESEKVKSELNRLKSNEEIIDLYNYDSKTNKVDKQSFIEFLNNTTDVALKKHPSFDKFNEHPSWKYLISNTRMKKYFDDYISTLLPDKNHKWLTAECEYMSNILSEDLKNRLAITTENSNFIDILTQNYNVKQLYQLFQDKSPKAPKADNSSMVSIPEILQERTRLTDEEILILINEFLTRPGFRLQITGRKLSIDKRFTGTKARELLICLKNHFKNDDFFTESFGQFGESDFLKSWIDQLLDFFHQEYGITSNREQGYSQAQLQIVNSFFALHNLGKSKKGKDDDFDGLKRWMQGFHPSKERSQL